MKILLSSWIRFIAEAGGFEPPIPCGILVFKTSGFNHSPTPPIEYGYSILIPVKNKVECRIPEKGL